jgi:hypothetical protein
MIEHSKSRTWGEVETQFHDAINEVVEADRLVKRVQHDVSATLTRGRQLASESDHGLPMGVSQWRDHGMKYGYWDHFSEGIREFARAQERHRILALMSSRKYRNIATDEDPHIYQLQCSGWNAFAQELRALLLQHNQLAVDGMPQQADTISQQYVDGYNTALDDVARLIESAGS